MVVPVVVIAGARAATSTGARQGAKKSAVSNPSNVRVINREDKLRQKPRNLMFDMESANDSRYDSIDVQKNASYAKDDLRGQIVDDLAERREEKKQSENNRLSPQRGGKSAQIYNFPKKIRRESDERQAKIKLEQEKARKLKLKIKKKKQQVKRAILSSIGLFVTFWIIQMVFSLFYVAGVFEIATFFGISVVSEALFAIGLVGLIGVSIVNLILFFTIAVRTKINPMGGEGATAKSLGILGGLIMTILPLSSFLPTGLVGPVILWKYPN